MIMVANGSSTKKILHNIPLESPFHEVRSPLPGRDFRPPLSGKGSDWTCHGARDPPSPWLILSADYELLWEYSGLSFWALWEYSGLFFYGLLGFPG